MGKFSRKSMGSPSRARRWRITPLGHTVLSAAIHLREEACPTAFLKTAA